MTGDDDRKEEYHFGMWAVGFVDLLGQKEAFLQADYIPDNDDEEGRAKFVSALKGSLGAISGLYDVLDKFEDGYSADQEPFKDLPDDRRALGEMLTQQIVRTFRWSDGIVLATPLETRAGHNPIMGVWKIMYAMGAVLSIQLARGRPIRGGIDVGVATEIYDQLFGSALVKAYVLESERAKYPRVVLGADFVNYLEVHTRIPGNGVADRTARELALVMRRFVTDDTDGERMIDIAGEMSQVIPTVRETGMLERALDFARASRARFQDDHNEKLFDRYSQLVRYLESRINS